MRSQILMAAVLFPLLACDANVREARDTDEDAAAASDAGAARTQIERVRNDWIAAAERDDAATVAAMYVDDAVMVSTGNPPARGRQAIQEALAQGFPMSRNLRVESHDLTVSGDVAYDYGEYSEQLTPPGGRARTESGHYLVVLKRQSDGSWKIVRHLGTVPSAAAATGPAQRTGT